MKISDHNKANKVATIALLLSCSLLTPSVWAQGNPPERANQEAKLIDSYVKQEESAPPERADQESSEKGFSTWDIQALFGSSFREPGVHGVSKRTGTLENSSGWSWGSSYFFADYLRSSSNDCNATEIYGEWYPSFSLGWLTGKKNKRAILRDILITLGVNAGTKNTGAAPLALLPGLTFDLKFPVFQFVSLGIYAYMDRGRFNCSGNGCNTTTYQITPSWSLPFKICRASFRFDGFIDYIGSHGDCAHQILAQPTIKLDLGNFFCKPNLLYAGVEWAYWRNKYGISGLNQNATQGVLMLVSNV